MKRKRIAALLLALCLLLACVPAAMAAESEVIASGEEETYAWKLTADGVLTISGTEMSDWAHYEEQRPWADSVKSIRKVIIEEGMTNVGGGAFQLCSNLTEVSIPEGVTSIGMYAFSFCTDLTEVTIPESVTSIGAGAFSCCGLTGTLTLSENVVDMVSKAGNAFGNNPNLTAIEVAEGNPNYCSVDGILYSKDRSWLYTVPAGIAGDVVVPEGVEAIWYAFEGCGKITSITLPSTLVQLSEDSSGCYSLSAFKVAEENSKFCEVDGILYNKDKTKMIRVPEAVAGTVTIPKGVTEVDENRSRIYDLRYSENLTAIEVEEGNPALSSVDGILYNKEQTEMIVVPGAITGSVVIPSGVTSIDGNKWNFCHSKYLTAIAVEKGNPVFSAVDGILYNKAQTEIMIVPLGITGKVVIPNSVTSISYDAKDGLLENDKLTAIEVEEGSQTFSSVEGILYNKAQTEIVAVPRGITGPVTIPNGVNLIYEGAFGGCSSLSGITIPNSVTVISNSAFWRCSSLSGITIPDSVTAIGDGAFFGSLQNGEVFFLGDRPYFVDINVLVGFVFDDTTTVYYPAGNATWEQGAERNAELGGRQPWQPYGGYNVIDGANGEWTEGSEALTVRADGALEKCTGVCVDGGVIDPANYTLESGSTIVKLHADYLKTLAKGEHILRILFSDGTAETKFTVKDVPSTDSTEPAPTEAEPTTPADSDNPQTYDTFTLLPAVLLVVSALGIVVLTKKGTLLR